MEDGGPGRLGGIAAMMLPTPGNSWWCLRTWCLMSLYFWHCPTSRVGDLLFAIIMFANFYCLDRADMTVTSEMDDSFPAVDVSLSLVICLMVLIGMRVHSVIIVGFLFAVAGACWLPEGRDVRLDLAAKIR